MNTRISVVKVSNINLDSRGKVKDKDKKAANKRKFVSPPKNLTPNNGSTAIPRKDQPLKKRRTITQIQKDHDEMVEMNNALFEPKSSRITMEQAANGIIPTATPNNLPAEESKDNNNNESSSNEEEEDDDDINIHKNDQMANYMSTRVEHSYNTGANQDTKDTKAAKDKLSEDDI